MEGWVVVGGLEWVDVGWCDGGCGLGFYLVDGVGLCVGSGLFVFGGVFGSGGVVECVLWVVDGCGLM